MIKIYVNFAAGIHQFAEPTETVEIVDKKTKEKTEKTQRTKGWEEREISTLDQQALRDDHIKIDFSKKTGELSFDKSTLEALAERRKLAEISAQQQVFGAKLLEYFLKPAVAFSLKPEEAVPLLILKQYWDANGSFPPLEAMAAANPLLYGKIQKLIEAGELPPFPGVETDVITAEVPGNDADPEQ